MTIVAENKFGITQTMGSMENVLKTMVKDIFPDRITTGVRRVTTMIDAAGRSIVASDMRLSGNEQALTIWATDDPPVAGGLIPPVAAGWWPPPGGVRVTLSSRKPDRDTRPASSEPRDWPDINDIAGFHASNSADIVIVISGTIWLELDDGVEIELRAGDTLVQNATRHRWHNHGDEWPIMAVVIVGAHPPAGSLVPPGQS